MFEFGQQTETPKDSTTRVKDSIKAQEVKMDSLEPSDETSKLEQAIMALASNLNVELSESLLLRIRTEDLKKKKLKSHLDRLEKVEHKMMNHMETIQTNIDKVETIVKGTAREKEEEFRFRDQFREWQESKQMESK